MLIIALVLALIGLVALVFAVVTSNELVAWVCIGASVLGVVLLIVDALRERQGRGTVDPDEVTGEGAESGEPAVDDAAASLENPEVDNPEVDYPEEVAPESEEAVPAEGSGEDPAK
jgi:hypothetical protein